MRAHTFLPGSIADVYIHFRALDQSTVEALSEATSPVFSPSLSLVDIVDAVDTTLLLWEE